MRSDWRGASPGAACVHAGAPRAPRNPRPAIAGTGRRRTAPAAAANTPARQRVAILVAAEADVAHRNAGVPRKLRGHPAGVGAALFDDEQAMVARPVRLEAEDLVDDEVFGLAPDRTRGGRPAVRARRDAAPERRSARSMPVVSVLVRVVAVRQQHDGLAGQAFAATERAEFFRGRGLDVDAVDAHAEVVRDVLPHVHAVGPDARHLREDREVGVDEPPALLAARARRNAAGTAGCPRPSSAGRCRENARRCRRAPWRRAARRTARAGPRRRPNARSHRARAECARRRASRDRHRHTHARRNRFPPSCDHPSTRIMFFLPAGSPRPARRPPDSSP